MHIIGTKCSICFGPSIEIMLENFKKKEKENPIIKYNN